MPIPALMQGLCVLGPWQNSSGSPAYSRTASPPASGRFDQELRVLGEGLGVGDLGVRADQAADPVDHVRVADHQAGLGQQGGGAQGQQALVARAWRRRTPPGPRWRPEAGMRAGCLRV